MIDLLDSHTHTIASGHAYSSMNDMIAAARDKGLALLALTEHAPDMPGTCYDGYFYNLKILPRRRGNLWTLFGVELNILNRNGDVDLEEDLYKTLDVTIASIHPPCYNETDPDAHLEAYLHVMERPYINIIGHPDDSRYPVDYKRLAAAAKEYNKLLEVNSSSLAPTTFRENAWENYREMLYWCRKYECPVIVNSDAHADVLVGDHEKARMLLQEAEFPQELIVNTNLDAYFSHVNFNPSKKMK
ncbi:MAG: phosphatase [Lachnospiraceae bacterium]|nr:phosphatase [Lachnospiraceae bacterium]